MARKIILLSDGTGNTPNKVWRTKVWRTFQFLDRTSADQLANYDDGVGTSSFIPLAVIGGMFGFGLKRNVINLYKFVCRTYQSNNDEIYAFGFSRGAFTIRTLIEIIATQGLVNFRSQAELDRKAEAVYRAHRIQRAQPIIPFEALFRKFQNLFREKYEKADNRSDVKIRFVGLWDTVAAYGLPIEALTRALSKWFWPLDLPGRELPKIVQRACHALSLDDERKTFHPILWNEGAEVSTQPESNGKRYTRNERISQVWFAGSHANVGGGYPDDLLAHVSLCWILNEAIQCGLKLKQAPYADPDAILHSRSEWDNDGRIYDLRKGWRSSYRYAPRKLSELCHEKKSGQEVSISVPKIHISVFKRVNTGARIYAPIGLPEKYEIVADDGEIICPEVHGFESSEKAKYRCQAQERVWDLVWIRRVQQLLMFSTILYVFLHPLFKDVPREFEFTTAFRPISDVVRLIGAFLPYATYIWIDDYAREPFQFAVLVLCIVGLHYWGKSLRVKITDRMAEYWHYVPDKNRSPNGLIYHLRTSRSYEWIRGLEIWPTIFAMTIMLLFIYVGVAAINRVAFYFEDSAGLVCKETQPPPPEPPISALDQVVKWVELGEFKTSNICQSMGVTLKSGERYIIAVEDTRSFADDQIAASKPFYSTDVPDMWNRLAMLSGVPFRRSLVWPWFSVVVRIGGVGAEERYLEPERDGRLIESFRPSRDGELFLYVNDAVVAWPSLYGYFYNNNHGATKVRIGRR